MNKHKLLLSDFIVFLLTFIIYFASCLANFFVTRGDAYQSITDLSLRIVESINDGMETQTAIDEYGSIGENYLSFYKSNMDKPYISSENNYSDFTKPDFILSHINSCFIDHDSYLGYDVCTCFSFCSGNDSYMKLEAKVPLSYFVAKAFLIYGSSVILLFDFAYTIFSVYDLKKEFGPLKTQIRKLQEIVDNNKTIVYDDDLKYLTLIVRDSRKELSEQFALTKIGEQKINFVLDSISQGLIVVDASYHIVMFNKKAMSIFGLEKSDIENKNIEVLHIARSIEINISIAIKTLRSIVYNENINGRIFQCNINPIDYSWIKTGEKNGASLLMIDITDEFNSTKMKREFFDNASHELKSPLTSILGYQQMIKVGVLNSKEDIDNAIDKSIKECQRMNKIIIDMLALSSLEKEELRPIEKINVFEQTRSILDSLDVQFKERKIAVHINDSALIIKMNFDDFDKLVRNLIDNAIKYNKNGGSIFIDISNKANTLSVKDTGIGISKENENRIFERFYRVDKARSAENGGTGLGLSIVKHICNYYEFSISVKSEINVGTEFIIDFGKQPNSNKNLTK